MLEMYKGIANSPETTITNDVNNTDTIIYVLDETRVPELPNLMVLGAGISAETVKVLSIEDNALTVERGFQGTPRTWNAGTMIARNFTEYDYNALVENIKELDEEKTTEAVADDKVENHNTGEFSHQDIRQELEDANQQLNEMATKLIGSNESARVFNNANQSIATNVTTTLSFNSEIFDNADMHDVSVNNSRLTAKTEGVYLISASLTFANNATGTFRSATLMLNGVTPITNLRLPNIAGQDINLNMTTLFKLNANDYITVTVRQDANTPVDVIYGVHYSPQFSIIRVG